MCSRELPFSYLEEGSELRKPEGLTKGPSCYQRRLLLSAPFIQPLLCARFQSDALSADLLIFLAVLQADVSIPVLACYSLIPRSCPLFTKTSWSPPLHAQLDGCAGSEELKHDLGSILLDLQHGLRQVVSPSSILSIFESSTLLRIH